MIRKASEQKTADLEHCHDGIGTVQATFILDGDAVKDHPVNFMHHTVLPPGTSVGVHEHTGDDEYYLILSGKGIMTLDEKEYEVTEGDITGVYSGGKHGLRNTGDTDLHMIVTSVS